MNKVCLWLMLYVACRCSSRKNWAHSIIAHRIFASTTRLLLISFVPNEACLLFIKIAWLHKLLTIISSHFWFCINYKINNKIHDKIVNNNNSPGCYAHRWSSLQASNEVLSNLNTITCKHKTSTRPEIITIPDHCHFTAAITLPAKSSTCVVI